MALADALGLLLRGGGIPDESAGSALSDHQDQLLTSSSRSTGIFTIHHAQRGW